MYAAGSTEFEIIWYLNEQRHRAKRGKEKRKDRVRAALPS